MDCQSQSHHQLHFVLFPFMAQGHMIPMVDVAKLLAQHAVIITIVTTPRNAQRFATTLARSRESGLKIHVIELEFPSQEEAGLPKGCENFDMLPSLSLALEFFNACNKLLKEPVERLFEELKPRPSCIISDMLLPYTSHVATKFGIPRISFSGLSCFCYFCLHKIRSAGILETVTSDSERFAVPGLPNHIEFTKNQLPTAASTRNTNEFCNQMTGVEMASYGIIINSFEELEAPFVEQFKKVRQDKVWCIGPVSLCNKEDLDKVHRGNNASIGQSDHYMKWLSSQQPKSVIYVCLGSICNLIPSQLMELGLGLEASNRPFIWVIRGGDTSKEIERLIEEHNFEERTKGRGFIIRGWAPQVAILSHPAIGRFLTHCSWNSTLEGICGGVPMITWPLFGDQFINEKLVVEVLRIGVRVGTEVTVRWGDEEKIGVLVKMEDVKRGVDRLMEEGEEGEERRERAKELSQIANGAMEKEGSSHRNMGMLIQDIMQRNQRNTFVHD